MSKGNQKYKIVVSAPLIRAGLSIETECSLRYLPKTLLETMEAVRDFNSRSNKDD